MIQYGRQYIDEDDILAVTEVLRGDYLTCGPKVDKFERSVALYVDAAHCVAVSSGTAALHAAMFALGISPGDEVIVPPMTFAATANCVVYQGGTPVFADVNPDTLLINPEKVEEKITPKTKAIIAVDYAGHPCDYDRLREITDKHDLALVADGCHALGAEYKGRKVGCLADMTVFSFHPVKHIATGEGGMIATDDPELARRLKLFRNHGIETDFREREKTGGWFYQMTELGYNYRLTDIQCALGLSQMGKLPRFLARRREIARRYDEAFASVDKIEQLKTTAETVHGYHLYVVRVPERNRVFQEMRAAGIGVNVHYIPVHLHPYYRKQFGTGPGLCPNAEAAYEKILSLPMHQGLSDENVDSVIQCLKKAVSRK